MIKFSKEYLTESGASASLFLYAKQRKPRDSRVVLKSLSDEKLAFRDSWDISREKVVS